MTTYQLLRVAKFSAVMVFAGRSITTLMSTDLGVRRRAAHTVAAPALVTVWMLGDGLLAVSGRSLFEFWVVASLVLSMIVNGIF